MVYHFKCTNTQHVKTLIMTIINKFIDRPSSRTLDGIYTSRIRIRQTGFVCEFHFLMDYSPEEIAGEIARTNKESVTWSISQIETKSLQNRTRYANHTQTPNKLCAWKFLYTFGQFDLRLQDDDWKKLTQNRRHCFKYIYIGVYWIEMICLFSHNTCRTKQTCLFVFHEDPSQFGAKLSNGTISINSSWFWLNFFPLSDIIIIHTRWQTKLGSRITINLFQWSIVYFLSNLRKLIRTVTRSID